MVACKDEALVTALLGLSAAAPVAPHNECRNWYHKWEISKGGGALLSADGGEGSKWDGWMKGLALLAALREGFMISGLLKKEVLPRGGRCSTWLGLGLGLLGGAGAVMGGRVLQRRASANALRQSVNEVTEAYAELSTTVAACFRMVQCSKAKSMGYGLSSPMPPIARLELGLLKSSQSSKLKASHLSAQLAHVLEQVAHHVVYCAYCVRSRSSKPSKSHESKGKNRGGGGVEPREPFLYTLSELWELRQGLEEGIRELSGELLRLVRPLNVRSQSESWYGWWHWKQRHGVQNLDRLALVQLSSALMHIASLMRSGSKGLSDILCTASYRSSNAGLLKVWDEIARLRVDYETALVNLFLCQCQFQGIARIEEGEAMRENECETRGSSELMQLELDALHSTLTKLRQNDVSTSKDREESWSRCLSLMSKAAAPMHAHIDVFPRARSPPSGPNTSPSPSSDLDKSETPPFQVETNGADPPLLQMEAEGLYETGTAVSEPPPDASEMPAPGTTFITQVLVGVGEKSERRPLGTPKYHAETAGEVCYDMVNELNGILRQMQPTAVVERYLDEQGQAVEAVEAAEAEKGNDAVGPVLELGTEPENNNNTAGASLHASGLLSELIGRLPAQAVGGGEEEVFDAST
ncbi:unnamed protein product [Chrysoparadoxa australica]